MMIISATRMGILKNKQLPSWHVYT